MSGNPGGRPPGFGALVRAETKDGAELVTAALAILRAKRTAAPARLRAIEWLADRGWGRPRTELEITASEGSAPFAFTLDIRRPEEAKA